LFGGQLREALGANKVSSTYAHTSPKPTTLAFVRLNNGQATYTFYDENTAGRMLAVRICRIWVPKSRRCYSAPSA